MQVTRDLLDAQMFIFWQKTDSIDTLVHNLRRHFQMPNKQNDP